MLFPALRFTAGLLAPAGSKGRLTILIYHRVLSQPDPMQSDCPDVDTFDWQMSLLARNFSVLPLAEAIERLKAGSLPPRPACVTFDDGYADNYENALPVLQRHGLSATFFVATDYLNGGAMWNDMVIEAVRCAPQPSLDLASLRLETYATGTTAERVHTAERIIKNLKHRSPGERADLAKGVADCVGVALPRLMMQDEQVVALNRAGMTIGAHTATHPILACVEPEDAREDIRLGRDYLAALIGDQIDLFAYPNGLPGRDYTARHVEIVKALGFRAAVSTAWGASTAESDMFQLPRSTPWDATPARFFLRLILNYRHRVQVV